MPYALTTAPGCPVFPMTCLSSRDLNQQDTGMWELRSQGEGFITQSPEREREGEIEREREGERRDSEREVEREREREREIKRERKREVRGRESKERETRDRIN